MSPHFSMVQMPNGCESIYHLKWWNHESLSWFYFLTFLSIDQNSDCMVNVILFLAKQVFRLVHVCWDVQKSYATTFQSTTTSDNRKYISSDWGLETWLRGSVLISCSTTTPLTHVGLKSTHFATRSVTKSMFSSSLRMLTGSNRRKFNVLSVYNLHT